MEPNHPFRPEIDFLNTKVVEIVTAINDKMNEVDTMNTLQEVCCSLEPPQKDLVIKGRRFVTELYCKGKNEGLGGQRESVGTKMYPLFIWSGSVRLRFLSSEDK